MFATGTKGLLLWCKQITRNYGDDVEVKNMTTSFKNGIAFCAIIHHYRPDLIDFAKLSKENIAENNELAFRVAEQELDIPALLDVEDMVTMRVPDKLSIMTYVSQYYNYFKDKVPGEIEARKYPTKKRQNTEKILSPPAKKSSEPLTPKQHGNESSQKPRGNNCCLCGKQVFLMERLTVESKLFHRICFKCSVCSVQLKTSTYEYDSRQGMFYCSRDYKERGKIRQEPIGKDASPISKASLLSTNGDASMKDVSAAGPSSDSPFKRNQEFARRGIKPQSSPADITWEKPNVVKSKAEEHKAPTKIKSSGKLFFTNLVKKKPKDAVGKRDSSDFSNPSYQQHLELSKYMNELDNNATTTTTVDQRVVIGSESSEQYTEKTATLSGLKMEHTSPVQKFTGTVGSDMSSSGELSGKSKKKKKLVLKVKKKKGGKDNVEHEHEHENEVNSEASAPTTDTPRSPDYENIDKLSDVLKLHETNDSKSHSPDNDSIEESSHDQHVQSGDQRRSSDERLKPRAVSLTINREVTEPPDASYQAARSNLKKVDSIDVTDDTGKTTEKPACKTMDSTGESYMDVRSRLRKSTIEVNEKEGVLNRSSSTEKETCNSARNSLNITERLNSSVENVDNKTETRAMGGEGLEKETEKTVMINARNSITDFQPIQIQQNEELHHKLRNSQSRNDEVGGHGLCNNESRDEDLLNDKAHVSELRSVEVFTSEEHNNKIRYGNEKNYDRKNNNESEQNSTDNEPQRTGSGADFKRFEKASEELGTNIRDYVELENASDSAIAQETALSTENALDGAGTAAENNEEPMDFDDEMLFSSEDIKSENTDTLPVTKPEALHISGTPDVADTPQENDQEMEVERKKHADKVEVVLPLVKHRNRDNYNRRKTSPYEDTEQASSKELQTSQNYCVDIAKDTTDELENVRKPSLHTEELNIKSEPFKNESSNPFDDSSDEDELPKSKKIDRSNPFMSSTEDLLDDENDDTFEDSNPFADDARLERRNTAKKDSLSSHFQRNTNTRLSQKERDHLQKIGVEESNPFAEDLLDESDDDNGKICPVSKGQPEKPKKKLVLKTKHGKKRAAPKAPGPPQASLSSSSFYTPGSVQPPAPFRSGKKRAAPKPPQSPSTPQQPVKVDVDDNVEDPSAPPKPPRRDSSRIQNNDPKLYANVEFQGTEKKSVSKDDKETAIDQPNIEIKNPNTDNEHSNMDNNDLNTDDNHPNMHNDDPNMGNERPSIDILDPHMDTLVSNERNVHKNAGKTADSSSTTDETRTEDGLPNSGCKIAAISINEVTIKEIINIDDANQDNNNEVVANSEMDNDEHLQKKSEQTVNQADDEAESETSDTLPELPESSEEHSVNGKLHATSSAPPVHPEKRKAPPRPKPPVGKTFSLNDAQISENIALRDKQPKREEIDQELQYLEIKQRELETEGVIMEKKLRECTDGEPEDAYLLTWFELVNQKNQLLRRENELIYMGQELDFLQNQRHAEFELRQLMMKAEHEKTEEDRDREEELLAHILELVAMRSNIVDKMDEERLREYEEDEEVRCMMEAQGLKSPSNAEKPAPKKKEEKKKKEKKKEKKEKKKK